MYTVPLTAGALKASLLANVVLGGLVLVLGSLNLWQFHSAAKAEGEAEGKATAATQLSETVGRVEALAETVKRSSEVAEAAQKDEQALLAELEAIAERGRQRQVVYRDRIKTLPPAACPPGKERMDATNEMLQ